MSVPRCVCGHARASHSERGACARCRCWGFALPPCAIKGCLRPRARGRFCALHGRRAKQRQPAASRQGLARSAVRAPRAVGISSGDWSGFLSSVASYREQALDRALAPDCQEALERLGPLKRRLLRSQIAEAAALTDLGALDTLELTCVPETGVWTLSCAVRAIAWEAGP